MEKEEKDKGGGGVSEKGGKQQRRAITKWDGRTSPSSERRKERIQGKKTRTQSTTEDLNWGGEIQEGDRTEGASSPEEECKHFGGGGGPQEKKKIWLPNERGIREGATRRRNNVGRESRKKKEYPEHSSS